MTDTELEQEVDRQKEEAIAFHKSQIKVMSNLINSIDEYIIKFGRMSNVHDQLVDLKAQVIKNKDHLEEWMNQI